MKKFLFTIALATVSMGAFAATPEEVKRVTPEYDDPANVVEAIVAQYPGKVVFVDFWATWCGPCLTAMKTIEPLKPWMEENGIVKVYISLSNSVPDRWEAMIGDIGGNHYWLTEEENNAALKKFGITGIPHYKVYDREGKLSFSETGYPGNDALKAEFEKLL